MTAQSDKWHAEALYLAKQWKGRADDAGRLARAVLESTPSHVAPKRYRPTVHGTMLEDDGGDWVPYSPVSTIARTPADISAWLIERPHGHGIEYLSIIEGPRFESWTANVNKACRFPSKAAAEECLGKRRLPGFEEAEAKEHMWCVPSAIRQTDSPYDDPLFVAVDAVENKLADAKRLDWLFSTLNDLDIADRVKLVGDAYAMGGLTGIHIDDFRAAIDQVMRRSDGGKQT